MTQLSESERQRIDTWKNIAAFFSRDESTVRRWEKLYGLPVHRKATERASVVFAFTDELQKWADEHLDLGSDETLEEEIPQSSRDETETEESGDQPSDLGSVTGKLKILVFALVVLGLAALLWHSWHSIRTKSPKVPSESQNIGASKPNKSLPDSQNDLRAQAAELSQNCEPDRNDGTQKAAVNALQKLNDALRADPDNAHLLAGVADCENFLSVYAGTALNGTHAKALETARRGVAQDPESAQAHRSLAVATLYDSWNEVEALTEFQKSLELGANDPSTHQWFADAAFALGDDFNALKQIESARKLEPASLNIQADRAFMLASSTRPNESTRLLRLSVRSHPDDLNAKRYLARALLAQRHIPELIPVLNDIAGLSHEKRDQQIADAIRDGWTRGRTVGALLSLYRSDARSANSARELAPQLATLALSLGRKEEAFKYLKTSIAERNTGTIRLSSSFVKVFPVTVGRNDCGALQASFRNILLIAFSEQYLCCPFVNHV